MENVGRPQKSVHYKETAAEKIKKTEKELADEKLKSRVLNMMIDNA